LTRWIGIFRLPGGLDLKPTRLINESLILQLAWHFSSGDSQWAELLRKRLIKNGTPLQHYFQSSVWCGIKEHMGTIISNSIGIVGTGANIKLWTDNWLGNRMVDLLHILHKHLISSVTDVIVDGGWNLPLEVMAAPGVANRIHSMVLPTTPLSDSLVWSHSSYGKLSSKQDFDFLWSVDVVLPWAAVIWKTCIPPSHSFIL
jgi:hypothetical protein